MNDILDPSQIGTLGSAAVLLGIIVRTLLRQEGGWQAVLVAAKADAKDAREDAAIARRDASAAHADAAAARSAESECRRRLDDADRRVDLLERRIRELESRTPPHGVPKENT